jgi:hypothetical protein
VFSLILQSDDEMGGGDSHDVTSFLLGFSGSEPDLEGRCARLTSENQSVVTDRGVRLDLRRAVIERLLGQPTRDSAGTAIYEVIEKRPDARGAVPDEPGMCGPSYDALSELRLRYAHDRVVWISGSRQDLC